MVRDDEVVAFAGVFFVVEVVFFVVEVVFFVVVVDFLVLEVVLGIAKEERKIKTIFTIGFLIVVSR